MESQSPPKHRRFPFVYQILIALALGSLVGQLGRFALEIDPEITKAPRWLTQDLFEFGLWLMTPFGKIAEPLGRLGSTVIDLIKALAGPLLFLAIIDTLVRTRLRGRDFGYLIAISATNATLALIIGLGLSNLLRPGDYLDKPLGSSAPEADARLAQDFDFFEIILRSVPKSAVQPFVENSILPIVILAVIGGLALRQVKDKQRSEGNHDYEVIERIVATAYRVMEVALSWVIALVPLAVFGVVARTVVLNGFSPFVGLMAYVGVALLGLLIQILVVYQSWIIFVSRMSLVRFWRGSRDAVAYALGASSSLATLPVTLKCLERLEISPKASRLAACVGTNLNNDGILLYEAMAVLFVAQVYGIELSMAQQFVAALACVIAGIGIAGIPEAGLISLTLVLTTVGLPLEIVPLLLTVDWALSRARAMTNVVADILGAVLLDRFGVGQGEDSEILDEMIAESERGEAPRTIPDSAAPQDQYDAQ